MKSNPKIELQFLQGKQTQLVLSKKNTFYIASIFCQKVGIEFGSSYVQYTLDNDTFIYRNHHQFTKIAKYQIQGNEIFF